MPAYCVADPRAQSYVVGASTSDAAHTMHLALTGIDPTPPFRDNYVWTVTLTDSSGAPLPGVAMTVLPWMPDHGHGAPTVTDVTDLGGGQYRVHNLDLFMEGIWTVTFRLGATPPGVDGGSVADASASDADAGDGSVGDAAIPPATITAVFTVCVGGT